MIDLYFFLVGSIIASFLGLVIDRFPEQSIIQPASHCDSCQTRLRPLDLIPIVSQVFNRFRCRYCKARYPFWYALFELGLGVLFLASCALIFSATELLILIQFASAAGILAFLSQKKKERLPFVPFLLLAVCLIIFGKLLLV